MINSEISLRFTLHKQSLTGELRHKLFYMKKLLQIPLLLVALFLISIPIKAHDFEVDGIYYNITSPTDNTVEVTWKGYSSENNEYSGMVEIPESVSYCNTDYQVTAIGNYAFYHCPDLTGVSIPNSVTNIGIQAFEGCTALTNVSISDSVTAINTQAFYDCSALTEISIPSSVTIIGRDILLNTGWYKNQPDGILYLDGCCLGAKGKKPTGAIAIEPGTRLIANCAFYNCTAGLTSVTIPESVTIIGVEAFRDCPGLTSVTIPNSITAIPDYAFYGCSSLTEVSIPETVTTIGYYAFKECALTEISIPSSVTFIGHQILHNTDWYNNQPEGVLYLDGCCLGYKGVLSGDVTIESGTRLIASQAFDSCNEMTSITIPETVTAICLAPFWNCRPLTGITVSSENPVYDSREDCNAIIETDSNTLITGCSSTVIPNSVTAIGEYAFCLSDLTEITIPGSVTSIGYRAFNGCYYLKNVTMSNSITSINDQAFYGCSELKNITISDQVSYIGKQAFYGCFGLTEITIPNSVTYIGSQAFAFCNIKSLTLSDSLSYIGSAAFNANEMKNLSIPESVKIIGMLAFFNCKELTEITIPESVKNIGDEAFAECSGLTNIKFPSSLKEIPKNVIKNCNNLCTFNAETTQTTAKLSLATGTEYEPYFYLAENDKYYKSGDCISDLHSGKSYAYNHGLVINGNYCYISTEATFETQQMSMSLNVDSVTATSVTLSASFDAGDADIESYGITISDGSEPVFDNKLHKKFENLEPGRVYTITFNIREKGKDEYVSITTTATTEYLIFSDAEAIVTSTSSVRLTAITNCDVTTGEIGFEWRRADAPESEPSSILNCPAVDGVLAGSLRNLDSTVIYQFRPYHITPQGGYFYGGWTEFNTADATEYYETDVRTFDTAEVNDNSSTIQGYTLDGTEEIISQGFEYWIVNDAPATRSSNEVNTVTVSGIIMNVTLTDLEYNSTYRYRAFATTESGTIYGEEMEFSTGDKPAVGIEVIEQADSEELNVRLRENPVIGNAWVNVSGCNDNEIRYFITSMSGARAASGRLTATDEWNVIELNCPAGLYLLTVCNDKESKSIRLIVK